MTEFELAVCSFHEPHRVETKYRLYYNADTGEPQFMTCEHPDGAFVEITKEEYDTLNISRVRVRNNQLEKFDFSTRPVLLLQRDPTGEFTTLSGDMMIVADSGDKYSVRTHE